MWRLDLVGYALFPRAGTPCLAAGACPASHIFLSLRTRSPPPSLGWAGLEKLDCLPKVFIYVRRAFWERFMLTVT